MRRVLSILLSIAAATTPASAADTTYRDPREPSFTLLVPDGWSAERNSQGVTLRREESYFQLGVMGGATPPGAMLVQLRPQFQQQWKDLRELEAGRSTFGGGEGAYVVYAGVPPSGIPSVTKIVTMTNGRLTFVAFQGMPADKARQHKPDLDRIERSFAPDPLR